MSNDGFNKTNVGMENSSSNLTGKVPLASWTLVPLFQLICDSVALYTNALVLYLFVRKRTLITPFNIYLIFLLVGNIVNSVVCGPLDVYRGLYEIWSIGSAACTFSLAADTLTQAFLSTIHVGISVNRIWATFFHLHYRIHNSKKLAALRSNLLKQRKRKIME